MHHITGRAEPALGLSAVKTERLPPAGPSAQLVQLAQLSQLAQLARACTRLHLHSLHSQPVTSGSDTRTMPSHQLLGLRLGLGLGLVCACAGVATSPTCAISQGLDFYGNDMLCANGAACPRPSAGPGACCQACATKPYYDEPIGLCNAWSFSHASSTCWMKTANSSHPHKSGDTSGVVISRGSHDISAPCAAVPPAERIPCGGGAAGAAQCAALGCCFEPAGTAAANDTAAAVPQCYYYGEPRGAPPACSLNGQVATAPGAEAGCVCDAGWEGKACERLRLRPANLTHGFNSWGGARSPGTSSWGATQLKGDDGLYHTWWVRAAPLPRCGQCGPVPLGSHACSC